MRSALQTVGSLVLLALGATAGCRTGSVATNTPLATGQAGLEAMVSDSFFIYWTMDTGEVRRVSLDGGKVETIATSQPGPSSIAIDADSVYWAAGDGAIRRVAKTGGDVTILAQASGVGDIAVDDTSVYFTAGSTIASVPKTTATMVTPALLATGQSSPHSLFVNGAVIWASQGTASKVPDTSAVGGVTEVPIHGGSPVSLVTNITPTSLFVGGGRLTWTDSAAGGVHTAAVDGTDVRDLAVADAKETLDSVVTDETNAYFTTAEGALKVVPLSGQTNAQVVVQGAAGRVRVAVDATGIYTANAADGSILALSKSAFLPDDNAPASGQPAPAQ